MADPRPGLLLAFAVLLYLGPDVEQRSWKLITPGAVAALVIWLVASGGFALYASRFGSYNKTWGTLSAVVVMLIWLWLTSAALLFGAEVNAAAQRLRGSDAISDLATTATVGAAASYAAWGAPPSRGGASRARRVCDRRARRLFATSAPTVSAAPSELAASGGSHARSRSRRS